MKKRDEMDELVYEFPKAKGIVASGDIHGDFMQLVFKCCDQYSMTDTLIIVAGDILPILISCLSTSGLLLCKEPSSTLLVLRPLPSELARRD